MAIPSTALRRWGAARLSRRLTRSVPVLGVAVGLFTLRGAMRQKGAVRGAIDTGLNATPILGTLKGVLEWWHDRDLFSDRTPRGRR